jgi:hypothetical protein
MLLWQGAIVFWFASGARSRAPEKGHEVKPLPEFPMPD